MKASKFTEAQKAFILKQGEEGTSVAEICRKVGIGHDLFKVPIGDGVTQIEKHREEDDTLRILRPLERYRHDPPPLSFPEALITAHNALQKSRQNQLGFQGKN